METPKNKHLACMPLPRILFFSFLLFFSIIDSQSYLVRAQNATSRPVRVGVVLDLTQLEGKRSRTSIMIAIEDFYAANPHFRTRISFDFRDSMNETVGAASSVVDLLQTQVEAIMGPQTSTETEFVTFLCDRAHVPLLSFSATSPIISPSLSPYFTRACLNDSSQSLPIASFIRQFGWHAVIAIYEDSNYGYGILPSLVDALQPIDVQILDHALIPSTAIDDHIEKKLSRLMNLETSVFLVHMHFSLAIRLFRIAQKLNMLSEGYVWIVTDSVGYVIDTLDPTIVSSMHGVVGFRPYLPPSNKITQFSARFKARYQQDYPGSKVTKPNMYQFWAYDATWAMAIAVEKANVTNPSFLMPKGGSAYSTAFDKIGVFQTGAKLLNAIHNTTFKGLAGNFTFVDGQLPLHAYEIFNMIGKSMRTIGFWNKGEGITSDYGNRNKKLKTIIWPGDSTLTPKGWVNPTKGKTLRIAVPMKRSFRQFVSVSEPITNTTNITGYCIDIFDAAIKKLPYHVSYEYVPFSWRYTHYDDVISEVHLGNFDAFVADTTITANRTNYVDFTLPYTDSGISMVVPIKVGTSNSMWIFLQPLTTTLWLTSLAFFFLIGFTVWVIEHRINPEFRGTKLEQVGLTIYFAFSTLVFSHNAKLRSILSRILVIIWVFVVLILTSSYTASLASMLTIQQLTPTITDVNELLRQGDYIGYQDGNFIVLDFLKSRLGVDTLKLRTYDTIEEYAEALAKGSSNGGVSAIFDEIPYLKVFLGKYCANHTMIGPTYKKDGFGFVFPKGSPMVQDVSMATEGDEMTQIDKKWLGDLSSCPGQGAVSGSLSLSFRNFAGLFIITGVVSVLLIIIHLGRYVYRNWDRIKGEFSDHETAYDTFRALVKQFDRMDSAVRSALDRNKSSVNSAGENRGEANGDQVGLLNNDIISDQLSGMNSPSMHGTQTQEHPDATNLTRRILPTEHTLELQQMHVQER